VFDWSVYSNGFAILSGLSFWGLIGLYWFTLFFEFPRYALGFPAVVSLYLKDRKVRPGIPQVPADIGKVSILIAGHNEADAIERGVRSLWQQSFNDFEIVCVSDGSTDETFEIMKRLQREGLVHKVAGCQIRGGKASAINLAARLSTGDIMIVIDCDCTFEPYAIAELLLAFDDPTIGGVSASVLVKNGDDSFVTSMQYIEYLTGMTLGKAQLDMFGMLTMISGAFGGFRREAWNRVNGMDPGPGEDLDISLRLRHAGYKLAFAHRAVAYTDAPTALFNLLRQRQRWERDLVWLRYRKYAWIMNPFRPDFRWREVLHNIDIIAFTLLPTIIFPFYTTWLIVTYGAACLPIMAASTMGLLVLDLCIYSCATIASGNKAHWRYAPYLLFYGFFQSYIMRMGRLYAMAHEWIYSTSRYDSFAPPKVNAWIRWK
jgi:cellulose synthase/poly-beta-1,6-N-acetylglucosamine synthase-like glycosyltransferase